MERNHINGRGTHTTIIEAARPILDLFIKNKIFASIQVSPGKIEGGIGAKSRSVKFKHINNELYEMVVTHNGSRQEFKIITTTTPKILLHEIQVNKKTKDWNVNYTDMRNTHKNIR